MDKSDGAPSDPETGLLYLRSRYYDPVTAQCLSRNPAVAMTRSAYGYVNDNPLNGTDPAGLWPWDGACVTFLSDNCVSIKDQHKKLAQQVANFAGGVVNGLTLGHGRGVLDNFGPSEGKVNYCSGWYGVGTGAPHWDYNPWDQWNSPWQHFP